MNFKTNHIEKVETKNGHQITSIRGPRLKI